MNKQNITVVFGGLSYVGFNYEELSLGAALLVAAEQIDQAADLARRTVLGDSLRALEYQITAEEAKSFAMANYEGEVPPTVQAWMDATDMEAQAATDNILAEVAAWKGALYKIRAVRLKGKQEVFKRTSLEGAEAVADEAIADIKASIQGVGNAA